MLLARSFFLKSGGKGGKGNKGRIERSNGICKSGKEVRGVALDKKTAKTILWVGTLSSLILFLILTVDTHRQIHVLTKAQNLSEEVVQGKRVWQEYNCNDCHTILGFGGYYAPDMTKVYTRIGKEAIQQTVKNPEKVLAKSWRKMPQQNLQDKEIGSLIAFLKWVSEIDTHDWPPQDSNKLPSSSIRRMVVGLGVSPGGALFKEKGCFSCHKIGGTGSDVGPPIEGVGMKYKSDIQALAKMIRNPTALNPNSKMPSQPGLTQEEAEQIATFLIKIQ
jgi:nitric oxide reductase subunit C